MTEAGVLFGARPFSLMQVPQPTNAGSPRPWGAAAARQNDSFYAVRDASIDVPFESGQIQPNGETRRSADLAAIGEQGAGN